MITVTVSLDPAIARHFLLRGLAVTGTYARRGMAPTGVPFRLAGGRFEAELDDATPGTLEIDISARYTYDRHEHALLGIRQVLMVAEPGGPVLRPALWKRTAPASARDFPMVTPPLHPLLKLSGSRIVIAPTFLDITSLFLSIHGHTPWFRALDIVKGTAFKLRVLAHLRGHPFIWYMVLPASVSTSDTITPHVFYWPADYGGFHYVADTEAGITTTAHHRSVGNVQCGGETLGSFLLTPLDHAEYLRVLPAYTEAARDFARFKTSPKVRLPPPLHHYRGVIAYRVDAGKLVPRYWDIPFGFERAIENTDHVLFFPQVNGGDAGAAIKTGVKSLVAAAIATVFTHTTLLVKASATVRPVILSCYSQSGGNLFTAAAENIADLRAIICIEPQYMNRHLGTEDKRLRLGREVIPRLLRAGVKVCLINRQRESWQRQKYLPDGVPAAGYTLLPTSASGPLFDYPQRPGHLLARHRYGRLLRHAQDATIQFIEEIDRHEIDDVTVLNELKVDQVIDKLRGAGMTDDQLIDHVFAPEYNADTSGGYYSHNFVIAGGESEAAFEPSGDLKPGARYTTFFEDAVRSLR